MRAWIENDDDITCFIEIDVYDADGNMIEAHGIQCRPLPWRMELDEFDIIMTSQNGGKEIRHKEQDND
jgi:hypothetical protein